MNQATFAAVDHYLNDLLDLEDEVLKQTEQSIVEADMPQHSISPNQGHFLLTMAKLTQAKNILEIGTLGGYSTIWLARSLDGVGKVTTLELDPDFAAVAQKNISRAGLASLVDQKVGPALASLDQLAKESYAPFDLVFIDADKPNYSNYFNRVVDLCRPGALIIADNVIRNGAVLDLSSTDEKVKGVQAFNQMLAQHTGVTATIIQNVGIKEYDGMALAVVK